MLYTCCGNGIPSKMPTSKEFNRACDGKDHTSCVFRVKKIDVNCATFRVLEPICEENRGDHFFATNSFFTMNL